MSAAKYTGGYFLLAAKSFAWTWQAIFLISVAGWEARPAGRLAKPNAGGFIPPERQTKGKILLSEEKPVV